MSQVLINGKAFSAADVQVIINNVVVAEVQNLSVITRATKANNYGLGPNPTSRGRGNDEYECTIEMAYKDALKLKNLVASRNLVDLPMFDVLAVLDNGQSVSRVRARNAEFNEDGLEVAQGDTNITREYPLIIAGVDFV